MCFNYFLLFSYIKQHIIFILNGYYQENLEWMLFEDSYELKYEHFFQKNSKKKKRKTKKKEKVYRD